MKRLLLSFLSPCGRIGIGGFWWRQLLLILPLYFCTFHASYPTLLMFGGSSGWVTNACFAPAILAQAAPAGWFSALAWGVANFQFLQVWENVYHYQYTPTGWNWAQGSLALLCLAAAMLLTWSSFALVLRRLRDTRVGLWVLPLCLTALWAAALGALGYINDWFSDAVICIPVLVALIVSFLPSRKAPQKFSCSPQKSPSSAT